MSEIKKEKKFDLKSFWVKIWKLLEPSQGQIKIVLVLILSLEAVRLIGPYLLKIIIDKITAFNIEEVNIILVLIVVMFLINQFVSIVDYFADRKIFKILVNMSSFIVI